MSPLFGSPNVEKLKTRRDVQGLIKALGYQKDPSVRQAAAKALGEIGDARAVEPLVATLKDSEKGVRGRAAVALGEIGDARAVEPLIVALEDVRQVAAGALGRIGDARAVEPLIATLKDGDENVRQVAARALGKIGDARAVEPLIATLKDGDKNVRQVAAEALGEIGDARAVEPLVRISFLDALGALVKIGTLAVEPLITVLKDGDKNARQVAAAVLGRIGDARAVEPLIVALEDVNVCSAAARALAQIGDVRAVEPLITVLKGRRIDARQAAAEALDSLGWNPDYGEDGTWYWIAKRDWGKCVAIGTAAVEPLITALKHRDSTVREAAAEALGRIGDARAVEPLIATLNDYNANLRRVAVQALENLGDKRAVEPLIAVLKDEGRDVRQKAAEALERFAWQPDMSETGAVYWIAKREWDKCVELGAPAVGPLIAALRDRDSTVREASVEALVKLGTPAVESLRTATLPSSDWAVRRAAASALERLGMPIPEAKPLSAAEEEQALSVLRRLCDAYATNDKAKIAKLEPLARQIGEEADWRGGLKEMRRLFEKLGGRRGSRTLEMHWGGIGDWRG